jgi:sigma-B regulation protein RsbU (phosphoserine phosphatase)
MEFRVTVADDGLYNHAPMNEQILLQPLESPGKKFWKSWKWIGLAVYIAALALGRYLPGPVVAAAYIYGMVVVANLVFFGFRYLRDRIFWRVRNRLIGSFIFVGVIPLLVVLGLVSLAAYLMFGQLAGQYLKSALTENTRLLSEINLDLAGQLTPADSARSFESKTSAVFAKHSTQFPRLAARLVKRPPNGTFAAVFRQDPHGILRALSPHPGDTWLDKAASYEGILQDGRKLLLISFRPLPGNAGFYIETAAPMDQALENRLRLEKSLYVTFIAREEAGVDITQNGNQVTINQKSAAGRPEEAPVRQRQISQNALLKKDLRKMIAWYLALEGKDYESGKRGIIGFVPLHAPWEAVFKTYMVLDDGLSKAILVAFYILLGLFIAVELLSLIVGGTINRHVTRSIHDMYQGILALQKGDLEHKIPVRKNDQLGLLAHSFNQMTGSISRLLEEVVEKKRLEKELEIAREVQATLFPKSLPQPPGMSLFGGCKPARMVSGDYYDFIVEDETHLNIVVGDISGKGISAALLMANLQAAMRSQILSTKRQDPEAIGHSLAEIMAQLNRQIYLNSPPEKYATLFLSRYDANSRRLWYCNAGHLPPIVLTAEGSKALEATGTVIGLLQHATYEAKSIDLEPGTLLAIYTDGVTEALNKADEEFGEHRLAAALQQSRLRSPEGIWEHVMSRVGEWQSDLPQYDDITLIVAKAS